MANAETWTKRVEEWRSSGLKAKAFCEGRDFSTQTLYRWAVRLHRAAAEGGPGPVRLARVIRRPGPLEARASPPNGAIWVELNGARVVVPHGAERSTVTVVLEALKATLSGGAR